MIHKGTILVVDDTPVNLRLMVGTLETEGYRVHVADSGELALASLAAATPDLILLDIMMPQMDGFEVYRRLRTLEAGRDIPVMFLSALTDLDHRVEGLKLGAVDFITKPFQREELLARVHTHVELRQLRIRLEQKATALQGANDALRLEIAERQRAEAERERLIGELQTALAEIKTLSGIIPICARCKKIRDDQGFWNQVESYISSHSLAVFSHGICPECMKKDFADFADED
jgi:DNA-binding response OmpR family regulator